ncbi:MAG: SusC/RagA family TonB-linked outer membrane protein [Sphingobacteriaceae bacterium]
MIKNYRKFICLCLLPLFITYNAFSQEKPYSGRVMEEKGNPVIHALITIKGKPETVVTTDTDGKFTIKGRVGDFIEITSEPRHKIVKLEHNLAEVILSEQDALIPVGFGLRYDRKDLTSAIGTVRSDRLSDRFVINPANALFGQIPGLAVLQNGGTSWENDPALFIRGRGTFRDASILVLVDGFERPMSSLSIGEIESVAVLKDGGALAIYGQRGANGVLLVSTKRADAQKSKVEIDFEQGITQALRLPEFLGAYDYAVAMNEARAGDGLSPQYSQVSLNAYKSGDSPYFYPNVNWMKETLKDFGHVSNLKATFQGRSKSISYFTLLNYQTDKGFLASAEENDAYSTQLNYGKFNFRSNVDIDITPSTKFKIGLSGNLRETRTPGTSVADLMWAMYNTPSAAYPVKTYNGFWGGTSTYNNNPVAQITSTGYRLNQTRELLADGSLEQDLDIILPGLSAEAAIAYDNSARYSEGKTKQYQYHSLALVDGNGGGMDSVETPFGQNTELNYYSNLGNQWRHATVLGKLKYVNDWGTNSIHSVVLYQQDKLVRNGQSNTFIHQLIAGHVHYARKRKYFADLSLSYSGSNMLLKGNRFGFFPALALGWQVSDENWFSNKSFFNDLRIRASWGMSGNDLLPQNLSSVQFAGGAPYFFTQNNGITGGLQEGALPSANLTYETSIKYNFGVDLRVLNILEINADVFYDRRKHILIESSGLISNVLGTGRPLLSEGIVDNKGAEIGINIRQNKSRLTYYISANAAYVRNKIVNMGEVYQPYNYLFRTGQRIGQAFGMEAIGFFKDQNDIDDSPKQTFSIVKPGDIKYKDQNDDGIINVYDERALGNNTVNPELYYGAFFGLGYKGFGLDVAFQGIANKTLYLNTPSMFWPLTGNSTIGAFSANHWTSSNAKTASLPRLSTLGNDNNYRPNSIWLVDGSYLKLRSLAIHYNLPKQFISKLKLENTRLIVRGMDLLSIDHLDTADPEVLALTYPAYATYSLGIQIGF